MKAVFLGTGTSVGVPAIGCRCAVCTSSDPRNSRLRTSLYLEAGGTHIVVDTTPDFRTQALNFGVARVDAVLFTHSHADHIFGFDDIRRFNTLQGCEIPVYGSPATIADMERIFDYVKAEHLPGVYRPDVSFHEVSSAFEVGSFKAEPLAVEHGPKPTYGYRLEAQGRTIGYFPDCLDVREETIGRLRGVDVMIMDALRHRPHRTHSTVAESVATLQRIGAGRSFIVHMCHDLDHEETGRSLPDGMFVSYDGLSLEW